MQKEIQWLAFLWKSVSIIYPKNWKVGVPFLAGNDANLLAFPVRCDEPRLPPLVIWGVDDMEDVAIGEAQALAWQTAVPRPVIVKQSSAGTKIHILTAVQWLIFTKLIQYLNLLSVAHVTNVKSVK